MYSFKLRKLEKMIDANQKQLKDAGESVDFSEDEMIRLIETNQKLKNIRSTFAKELNRIVTK